MPPGKPSKSWCFTLNNYTAEHENILQNLTLKYGVYGREVGESGTPHLQGFILFARTYRLAQLKKIFPTAHWEIAKVKDAENYCLKDGDFVKLGDWDKRNSQKKKPTEELLDMVKAGATNQEIMAAVPTAYAIHRNKLDVFRLDLLKDRTEAPIVIWIYGPTGVGKSHFVCGNWPIEKYAKIQDFTFTKMDQYTGQDIALFDDYRFEKGTWNYLLQLTDKYPCYARRRYSDIKFVAKMIVFTAPHSPEDTFYHVGEDVRQITRRLTYVVKLPDQQDVYDLLLAQMKEKF